MSQSTVELINTTIDDLVMAFFYYDRKEDEELPLGEIEREISLGNITIEDIVSRFGLGVVEHLG